MRKAGFLKPNPSGATRTPAEKTLKPVQLRAGSRYLPQPSGDNGQ